MKCLVCGLRQSNTRHGKILCYGGKEHDWSDKK